MCAQKENSNPHESVSQGAKKVNLHFVGGKAGMVGYDKQKVSDIIHAISKE